MIGAATPNSGDTETGHRMDRVLRWGRWVLPVTLSAIAIGYELAEHAIIAPDSVPEPLFVAGEILFFGLLGPLAVASVFVYIRRLLAIQLQASARLKELNRDLELIVAERTRHLEQTKEALEARNEALARANAELRQLDNAKSEFVSLVSHALRAPLTTLNGALELIAQDAAGLPAPVQSTLSLMAQEGARLHSLVQMILDVSRLEAGKLTINAGPLSLEPLLRRAATVSLSGQPGRLLLIDIPRGLPPAWADDQHVQEVVSSLVSNASKYSSPEKPIHIDVRCADGVVSVAVTDHGPGVRPEEQLHVFDAFWRTPLGERADAGGRGLGLYFARKLIEANGGRIWVESPVWPDPDGPGARFAFDLAVTGEVPDETH